MTALEDRAEWFNARQCKAARALLDWTQDTLAEKSGVPLRTLAHFEQGSARPRLKTTAKLLRAFEAAGVDFIVEPGCAGVRVWGRQVPTLAALKRAASLKRLSH